MWMLFFSLLLLLLWMPIFPSFCVDSLCCEKINGMRLEGEHSKEVSNIVDFVSFKQNEPKCPKVFGIFWKWHYLCLQNKALDVFSIVLVFSCACICACIFLYYARLQSLSLTCALSPFPVFWSVCHVYRKYNFNTQHLAWIEISLKLLNFSYSPFFWCTFIVGFIWCWISLCIL